MGEAIGVERGEWEEKEGWGWGVEGEEEWVVGGC